MTPQTVRILDISVAVLAVAFFVARRTLDVAAPVQWTFLAAMVVYTLWALKRRSPYRGPATSLKP